MSEGEKKKIFINPNLFSIENVSRKKREKPEKAIRIKPTAKPISDKTRKNQILKKIRENQEKQYKSLFEGEKIKVEMPKKQSDKTNDEFQSDFDKSLTFMNAVADAKPTPIARNHTFKNTSLRYHTDESLSDIGIDKFATDVAVDLPIDFFLPPANGTSTFPLTTSSTTSSTFPVSASSTTSSTFPVSSSPMTFAKQPEYGCLKNGNLPTLRSLHNRTMKNLPMAQQAPNPVVGSLKTHEEKMEIMRKLHQQKKDADKPKPQIVQRKVKKLLRRTFNVGKDKYRPKVGVLLPNRTIRNNVTNKSFMIKQKPIGEIRKFLIQQGFIKVGSTAPTDVLRKIYESVAMIDGDVKNHNPDNLLYNFFKGTEKP
jgi:hypothetical protein